MLFMTMYKVDQWEVAIVWFRRDLRLSDHPALTEAIAGARSVVPLFILDEQLLSKVAPARAWFLQRTLVELERVLRERGSGLLVRGGDPAETVPQLARELGADVVLASSDVTSYARARDARVAEAVSYKHLRAHETVVRIAYAGVGV